MPDPHAFAGRARQLLILANACEDEEERTTYYALAEACLQEMASADRRPALQEA